MPIELGVRAAQWGLRIVELPVPLIYLDEKRSFGGSLDDAETRLAGYRAVLDRARLEAPRKDRAVLISPPFDRVPELAAENLHIRSQLETYDLQGRTLADISQLA